MKKLLIFIILLCFTFFLQAGRADESGCITCHTNEQTLKMLHKPVKTGSSEGEG